jgi:hypothetical protein
MLLIAVFASLALLSISVTATLVAPVDAALAASWEAASVSTPTITLTLSPTASLTPTVRVVRPTPTPTRRVRATPSPTPTPTPFEATVNRNANLRGGPGTNYPVVGSARANDIVFISGRNQDGTWYALEDGAWIAAFLVVEVPENLPEVEAPPVPTAVPTRPPAPVPTSVPVATTAPERAPESAPVAPAEPSAPEPATPAEEQAAPEAVCYASAQPAFEHLGYGPWNVSDTGVFAMHPDGRVIVALDCFKGRLMLSVFVGDFTEANARRQYEAIKVGCEVLDANFNGVIRWVADRMKEDAAEDYTEVDGVSVYFKATDEDGYHVIVGLSR